MGEVASFPSVEADQAKPIRHLNKAAVGRTKQTKPIVKARGFTSPNWHLHMTHGGGFIEVDMSAIEAMAQDRFAFPEPTDEHKAIMWRIVELMKDGQRRSKKEIRFALGLDADVEIGARIRDARKPENGAWPFTDSRAEGPDDDGVYRWQMRTPKP